MEALALGRLTEPMTNVALVLTTVAALGCAVAAGVLFSFSAFVMRALAGLPAPQGIAAMQSINLAAVRPWLMGELFGTAAVCVGASLAALSTHTPGSSSSSLERSAIWSA